MSGSFFCRVCVIERLKMNKRTLRDGSQVDSYDKAIDLIIHTKCPAKWKLIDLETGKEYIGSEIPHSNFAEVLRNKVINGFIGSWFKTKGRDV